MALSNTATPIYYGQFRDAVMLGDIPVNREISLEMPDDLDRTMAELPGMGGCAIFRHAREEAQGRADAVPERAPGMWSAVPA